MGFGVKNVTDLKDGEIKNNLNATAAPSANNDSTQGYSVGSVWIYNGVTYTCTDDTGTSAKWRSETQTHYSETWDEAVTWMLTGDYSGWYVVISTANGAPEPSVGVFTGTVSSKYAAVTISDGGQATISVTSSSASSFTVKTQPRTVTNPVIKIVLNSTTAPSVAFTLYGPGYYIWTELPSSTFAGMAINNICQCSNSGVWSTFQTYANAPSTVLVGSGSVQALWGKVKGGWAIPNGQVTYSVQGVPVASPAVNTAYLSPNQYGGIYGANVKRCYTTLGAVAAGGAISVNHGQTVNTVLGYGAIAKNGTMFQPLPYVDYGSAARSIEFYITTSIAYAKCGASASFTSASVWFDYV